MQNPATHPSVTIDLRGYLNLARRRKWSIALISLAVMGGAILASIRQTPIYESTAQVAVNPLSPDQVLGGYSWTFLQSMPNEVTLASGPQVGKIASSLVRTQGGDGVQTGAVSVDNPPNTTLLNFTYADPSPEATQMWAQAYAEAYIQRRDAQAEAVYAASTAGLQNRLTALQRDLADKQQELLDAPDPETQSIQSEINYLFSQLGGIEARIAAIPVPYAGATELIAAAKLPTSPSRPKPVQNGVVGLMLGLALGVGLALLRERLDDRTAGKDDLEREIGAPVIGVVPKVEGWRQRKAPRLVARDEPMSIAAEAYRTVRANLQFLAATEDIKVIAVASAHLGEGKTTTTANIAVILAQTGKRVIALSCDLRKPRLHDFFGLGNEPGLVELLRGEAALSEVAQRTDTDAMRVIASGRVPQNPAELLGSDQTAKLLKNLREVADFIVLDTPPVLAVSDALMIARLADGVLVVADAASTTRSALAQTREQLEQLGSRIIGGIYNDFDPSKSRTYYSKYYRSYYAHEKPSRTGPSEAETRASGNGDLRTPAQDEPSGIWS